MLPLPLSTAPEHVMASAQQAAVDIRQAPAHATGQSCYIIQGIDFCNAWSCAAAVRNPAIRLVASPNTVVTRVLCLLLQGQEPSGSSAHNKSLHCIACDTAAAATADVKTGCGK